MVAMWIIGFLVILSSLGVILAKKPVHSGLSFLLMLFALSTLYLELSAQFIAVMQILVYAGAILVIFMFVIVLFQDAHDEIAVTKAGSWKPLLWGAAASIALVFVFWGFQLIHIISRKGDLPNDFGRVQPLGRALYLDFFFPFEAVILIFLVAIVGSLYMGKKER
jgi:NADH-quinone oxidoreductase subunit J